MHAQRQRVYLDHNATSPIRPEALDLTTRTLADGPANASSQHAEGRAARAVIEEARERVAFLIEARPSEVVFNSCGSEGLSAAVRGVFDRAPRNRRRIVVSSVEHSAVLEAARAAGKRGAVVNEVACGSEGRVALDEFRAALGPDVALAALQWANNETGVMQPIEEVGSACRRLGIPFLVDAVQAAGKVAVDFAHVPVDLLAVSSHKLGGPQGGAALVVREGLILAPLVAGGAQENRRRGGTASVAALAGFGVAAEIAQRNLREEANRLLRLRARVETRLRELYGEIRFHGQASPRLPNTVNFALPGIPGETLAIALDLAGFSVSTGSACASGAVEPSHVIRAMGFDEVEARGAIRVSMGWSTTAEEIAGFLEAIPRVVAQVRSGLAEPA